MSPFARAKPNIPTYGYAAVTRGSSARAYTKAGGLNGIRTLTTCIDHRITQYSAVEGARSSPLIDWSLLTRRQYLTSSSWVATLPLSVSAYFATPPLVPPSPSSSSIVTVNIYNSGRPHSDCGSLSPHLSLRVMETNAELLTLGGVEVRRIKPGVYIREDEWQGYLEFNEVRSIVRRSSPNPIISC